ncbi:uncharacterized protein LOC105230660 isoform X3 [Bactrocera dorsalis]|uniref:Uncharacterized protein LOC105230660 isoform X3 n=1 Tax=Bactrocera dorsalis TaxID=27457 RepID=A0A8N4L7F3_BACDO|nr:uncharacterized protein LOC105230660 isoform X3 [Bactrocera dorsalis]
MIQLFILLSTWLFTEKCYAEQNNQTDCSRLPKSIAPHICCRFPELFEGQILDECHRLHNEFGQNASLDEQTFVGMENVVTSELTSISTINLCYNKLFLKIFIKALSKNALKKVNMWIFLQ